MFNHEPAGSTPEPSTPAHRHSRLCGCPPWCAQPPLSHSISSSRLQLHLGSLSYSEGLRCHMMPHGGITASGRAKLQKTTCICPSWGGAEAQQLHVPAAWPHPCSCQKAPWGQPKGRTRCWLHNLTSRAAQIEIKLGDTIPAD